MEIEAQLENEVKKGVTNIYSVEEVPGLQVQKTRKEFKGDFTVVVFPLLKLSRKSPEQTANEIGEYLLKELDEVADFNVIKGFLNISMHPDYWMQFFKSALQDQDYGLNKKGASQQLMVEYSSPNTNKPLHLGHLRNNFLGDSISRILAANGNEVVKVQIINDRGIHICKSMLAWQHWGNGETPESSGLKGDHLVGKYYVVFNQHLQAEVAELMKEGMTKQEAENKAPLMLEVREMLKKWEEKDAAVVDLWKTMNAWVYKGFETTYETMGVSFDKLYYESDTFIHGKEEVLKGLEKGIFFQKEDGSIWADLTDKGLDEKLLLRKDGTSVYMTQDIGTAILRFSEYEKLKSLTYVVGNEQDYHFKALFLILEKLGYQWGKECHHLSYGMVDLPTGKMKSREGTVVDADDLMAQMTENARKTALELGKLDDFSQDEKDQLYEMVGLGALKYFILKVDPKKRMLFDPEESVDFSGNTGPFIQYTYARIQSILRKSEELEVDLTAYSNTMTEQEQGIVRMIYEFSSVVSQAGSEMSPALIANYIYDLVKAFNHYYQTTPILKDQDKLVSSFRINLSSLVGKVIKRGMELMGIGVPERM